MWKCPTCGSTKLEVEVTITARLFQRGDEFETDVDNSNHEWNHNSPMWCEDCLHSSCASDFETDED